MRVLLVNGSHPTGGSSMSTHAFGRALVARGHDVMGLVRSFDRPRRDLVHEQLVDASVRAPGVIGRAVAAVDSVLGRRVRPVAGHGYPVWSTPYPEHALPRLLRLFQPELIVGNSIDRVSWRRCAALARRAGTPTALHLREEKAIGHLTISGERPDLLLANAQSLVDLAADAGHRAFLVPSVVDLDGCTVASTRRVALLVNPMADFGLDLALRLAAARPEVPLVLQESWPLGDELESLRGRVASLPNVEVRARRPTAEVFADARVLLVPHRTEHHSNRPRVVLEAQHNGIPVVATDFAGLREAVGAGGALVPVDATDDQWLDAFDQVWADPSGDFGGRARAHAARPEVQPGTVVTAYEAALRTVGLTGEAPTGVAPEEAPGLSVVVPAHDAEPTVGEQLDALLAQEWASEFEVIVADNLSTDGTAGIVRTRMSDDGRLRLIEADEAPGASAARNAGVRAARFASVAFCDADDVVADGWIAAMGEALRVHDLVAGRLEVQELNPPGAAASRGLAVSEGPGRFGPVPFAHSCNLGVRRAVLDAAGGWDPSMTTGEDIELCMRLWARGVALHYDPAAEIHYRYRGSASQGWRQAVRYGEAHVHLARRLEIRQLPAPSRGHGLRNVAWVARHLPDLADDRRRPHWLWTAGLTTGRLRAALRPR